jgi:SAM-dependent methyltransferase
VSDDGAFEVVVDGYDKVYAAMAASSTLRRLWAQYACGGDFPADFSHISFLTFEELRAMSEYLALGPGSRLADLACGAGGPGLWVASHAGASLVGVDPSATGLAEARRRAESQGFEEHASYHQGTFAATGIDDASVDAVLSVDGIQYAPHKRAVFREVHRILGPGGRMAFSAFEADTERVAGLRVFGVDPIADYAPLLDDAGFTVDWYRESAGWAERVRSTFEAVIEAMPALTEEMGETAASALRAEATFTLQIQPYRRRMVVAAHVEKS